MPLEIPKIPDITSAPILSDEAGSELPRGDKPLSASKGAFSVWVIRVLSWFAVGVLSILFWVSMQDKKDLKDANKQLILERNSWQAKYFERILSENAELKGIRDTVVTIKEQQIK